MVKKNLKYLIIIFVIFITDRLSKLAVIKLSKEYQSYNLNISSFLNIELMWNNGVAFGLLSLESSVYYNLLTLVIIMISLIILWLAIRSKKIEKLGYLIIFGGSMGNIFDRLYYNSVPDFIDFHFNNYHWFVFNVADIFITTGIILLILNDLFLKKNV